MPELYESLGFTANPFSRFSAEEELDYLTEVFLPPKYFKVLSNDIASGGTRFIVGNRGSGKSALMYQIIDVVKGRAVFPILIDSFDGVPSSKNEARILQLVIENCVTDLAVLLLVDRTRLKRLSFHQKQTLATLLTGYSLPINKSEFDDRIERLQSLKVRNWVVRAYNKLLRRPLNVAVSFGIEAFSDIVAKSLGLPKPSATEFYKDYLPEVKPQSGVEDTTIKPNSLDYASQKRVLEATEEIILSAGFDRIAVFFDKIDEFPDLQGKVSVIARFLSGVCTDTSLLQRKNISFVFVLWTKAKSSLADLGVRFDKFKAVDVNWQNVDIGDMFAKRVAHFSDSQKNPSDILDDINRGSVLRLSSESPRDMITVLSHIYDEQSMINETVKRFEKKAIESGVRVFAEKYDYISFYASKDIAQSVVSSINRILQVGKVAFTLKDLATVTRKSQASASNYTRAMREYGLVIENDENTERTKEYLVTDPKVKHLINIGIKSI
jgi:hypothetical protein